MKVRFRLFLSETFGVDKFIYPLIGLLGRERTKRRSSHIESFHNLASVDVEFAVSV